MSEIMFIINKIKREHVHWLHYRIETYESFVRIVNTGRKRSYRYGSVTAPHSKPIG